MGKHVSCSHTLRQMAHVLHSKAKHLSGAALEGWDSEIMKTISLSVKADWGLP